MRVDLGYFEHPKVRKLERVLGDAAALLPLKLWRWAVLYARDGEIEPDQVLDVAIACGWPEKPERLIAHFERAGFLARGEGGRLLIHDWSEHQGKVVDRARADAQRHREYRARQRAAGGESHEDVPQTSAPRPQDERREAVAVPSVPRSLRGHQPPVERKDLGAYFAVLEELWPEQPLPSPVAIHRALQAHESRLPPLDAFRANLEAWVRSDRWERVSFFGPEGYVKRGTCENPPPTRRSNRSKGSLDGARREVHDLIFAGKLPDERVNELVRKVDAATTLDELGALREEIRRAVAA